MQQKKSAIEKLLDEEFARTEPATLHGIADVGLRGISAIDDGVHGLKRKLLQTMRGGVVALQSARGRVDRALMAMGPARPYRRAVWPWPSSERSEAQ